jgi:predicted phosphodiesterase
MSLAPGTWAQETLEPPEEVKFVVLGDTQFANMGTFERMVHEIDLLQPHFVIQVGDLISGYTHDREQLREEWRVFRRQIGPLSMPFFPVPGNHDVVTPESEEIYAKEWGENRFHYSFDIGPAHIVSLNSWWQEEDDRIMPWQREWLAEDLAAFAERRGDALEDSGIFVFLHSPLWRYAEDHPGRQDWSAVEEIFADYPVRLVVGGHTHEHVYDNLDGIHYLIINSSRGPDGGSENRGGQLNSFLHVTFKEGAATCAVVEAGSVFPLDTVDSYDRASVPRHYVPSGTFRLPAWRDGEPLETTIEHELSNRTEQDRLYRLEWHIPRGAEIAVEPQDMWVDLSAGERETVEFTLTANAAPAARLRPWLEVSADSTLPTRVVSRDWEAQYRAALASAEAGFDVETTNIALDEAFTFTGRHTIYVPPVAIAARAEGEITIDGDLSDAAWGSAEAITEFSGPAADDVETSLRLLWDDDGLFVGAWFGEPNPEGMVATAEGDIPLTWNDDDLELFFDPNGSGRYHRLFQNCVGTRFNSLPRDVENKYYESEYASAITVVDDHWTLEMHIPWHEMGADAAPETGDIWNIQIGRHRQQSENPRMIWSGGSLYDPSRYGVLEYR